MGLSAAGRALPAVVAVMICCPGCTSSSPPPSAGPVPPGPGVTSVGAVQSPAAGDGIVVKVTDGDTVDVQDAAGAVVKVRILGVDAPEARHGATAAACGADQATHAMNELAGHRQARLVRDPRADPVDRYGRALAYLEVAGVDVGGELIQQGYAEAWAPRSAVEPARLPTYREWQQQARQARRGAWATCSTLGR